MESEEEKIQNCVIAAIMKVENCKDAKSAARYASMNYTVYQVAMESVRMAKEVFGV
jgi:hypothetical protein